MDPSSAADGCGPLLAELRPFFEHATSVVDAAVAAARPADSPAHTARGSSDLDADMASTAHSTAASPPSSSEAASSPGASATVDFLAPIEVTDEVTEMFLKYLPRLVRYDRYLCVFVAVFARIVFVMHISILSVLRTAWD